MAAGSRVVVDSAAAWPEDAMDVEEAIVANWFVREGAHVAADEVLCEIQVEKVSIDVLAPVAGEVVALLVGETDEFVRGDPLAEIAPE
jgi:pyruvate/2-oxoglutarate dehydrogenase complex dihydrolipoamide acyltransferase (E2) component